MGKSAKGWSISSVCLLDVCLVFCLTFVSCKSATAGIDAAKTGVAQFHAQLDTEQYAQAYAAADQGMHQKTSETQFTEFLQAVHKKLGTVQTANLTNTRIAWYTSTGETVTLDYQTAFSGGSGVEEFVWHIDGNRALLYGYHINSNDLVLK